MSSRRAADVGAPGRSGPRPGVLARHTGRMLRYAGGSGVATVCSAVGFWLVYAVLDGSTTTATVLGWLAGAVPNYVINRTWVWRVRGRPSARRELLPYVAVVLLTLALATGATALTERVLEALGATDAVRVLGVNAAFLGVYALMALVRYVVLHQLFRRLPGTRTPTGPTAGPTTTPTTTPTTGPRPEDAA
ncbi:GtrA family protein [Pseudokineococcus basanitobsidens]|uniref:GtrA family protein n=1 Tax=Pseudokineococcus basanitobsidens TaxID=1926649 RepID=A0ABU8RNN0_9ACTN